MCPFQFQALLAHLNLPMAYHGIQCRSNFHTSLHVVTLAILPDVTVQITVLFIHSLFYDSVSAREQVYSINQLEKARKTRIPQVKQLLSRPQFELQARKFNDSAKSLGDHFFLDTELCRLVLRTAASERTLALSYRRKQVPVGTYFLSIALYIFQKAKPSLFTPRRHIGE